MNIYKYILFERNQLMDPGFIAYATMIHVLASTIINGFLLNFKPYTKIQLGIIFEQALYQLSIRNYVGYRDIIREILHIAGDIHENIHYDYDFITDEDGGHYIFMFDFTDIVFEMTPIPIPNDILDELYQDLLPINIQEN